MAYAKRTLKKRTTKKRSSMKRKAPKAKVTSRGRAQNSAPHRQTGYVRALLDPKDGPLVGVPQFVPIDTHRVRARSIGTVQTGATNGHARIFFNPCRMVADSGGSDAPIRVWTNAGTGACNDSSTAAESFKSNVRHSSADFQDTTHNGIINNPDGVKARVVAAMIRVCNVSASQARGGVFTALHEPHHKSLENFTLDDLSNSSKSIIRPAGDGGYVSLLYRPVKPEEVEEWQTSSRHLPGQAMITSDTDVQDGSTVDSYPGYMAIDYQGEHATTLHVEAYAIIEYAGESMTTLSRPIHIGGGRAASPGDGAKGATDAANKEQLQGTSDCEVKTAGTAGRTLAQCDAANGEAQQHADKTANIVEKDPPQVIRETRYSIVIENPDGTHSVYFKGTATPGSEGSAREWGEDGLAYLGFHLPAWDRELQYLADTYGYESDTVSYSGFSRGGGWAQYMGGTGYGSGVFGAYPPREGSKNLPSNADWHDSHTALNAWIHDHMITPVSEANMHPNALGVGWVQEEANAFYDKYA